MQGVEVGIEEVLMCRERRVDIQNEMLKKYNMPIISFTMNIPGSIKTNQQIKKAFDIGKKLILEKLKENNIEILEIKELDENIGNELFISVDSTAEKIKNITIAIEESSQLGRFIIACKFIISVDVSAIFLNVLDNSSKYLISVFILFPIPCCNRKIVRY